MTKKPESTEDPSLLDEILRAGSIREVAANTLALTPTTATSFPNGSLSTSQDNLLRLLELPQDDYRDVLMLTPEEEMTVRKTLQRLGVGSSAALPLDCAGDACPFHEKCPFWQIGKAPEGKPCLVEINLMNEWTRLYIQEYDVNPQNFTQVCMVRELVEIEIKLWRLNNNLSKPENAEMVQDTVVGVDKQGNVLTRKEVSAYFEAQDRLVQRRSRLHKLMVGDPQEKYKREAALKKSFAKDPSQNAAELRQQILSLLKVAQSGVLKLKEAEGNVIDVGENSSGAGDGRRLSPEDLINQDG